MEQPTKIVSVAALPQVRVLGRTTGTDVVNLFWTGSGIEFIYTGSEIQVEVNADYDAYEPWLAVELNGVQIGRVPLNKGKNEVCLFRGMTVGKPKHVRILKEVQAMHQDPGHLLQIVGLQYADGEFLQLPEPKYRLEQSCMLYNIHASADGGDPSAQVLYSFQVLPYLRSIYLLNITSRNNQQFHILRIRRIQPILRHYPVSFRGRNLFPVQRYKLHFFSRYFQKIIQYHNFVNTTGIIQQYYCFHPLSPFSRL